jgi:hypothetical protein
VILECAPVNASNDLESRPRLRIQEVRHGSQHRADFWPLKPSGKSKCSNRRAHLPGTFDQRHAAGVGGARNRSANQWFGCAGVSTGRSRNSRRISR